MWVRKSWLTSILWKKEAIVTWVSRVYTLLLLNYFQVVLVEHSKKLNESGFRPPLCIYLLNWARRTSWGWWDDWDRHRHMIRNSSPGGLRSSTLPLGHGGSPQYWLSHVDGEETFFVSFKPPRLGTEPRTLAWKAAVLTTTIGPPPVEHSATRH